MIDVKPPKPLLHANFGGYFLFQDDGLCAASFHFPFDSCNATGCHAIALGCSVASRRFLRAAPRGVWQAHPHHLPRYRRLPCVLRAHPPVPRRQRQDGAHDHVPRVPARRAVPFIVLDADIIIVSAAIRMFRHDGEGAFQSSSKHMVEPNLESSPPASS